MTGNLENEGGSMGMGGVEDAHAATAAKPTDSAARVDGLDPEGEPAEDGMSERSDLPRTLTGGPLPVPGTANAVYPIEDAGEDRRH